MGLSEIYPNYKCKYKDRYKNGEMACDTNVTILTSEWEVVNAGFKNHKVKWMRCVNSKTTSSGVAKYYYILNFKF